MKKLLPIFLLIFASCQDETSNPLEYQELPVQLIEQIFTESIEYPFSYTITGESGSIVVLDTITYSLSIDSLVNVINSDTEATRLEPDYDGTLSVISTQHAHILLSFTPTEGVITTDSVFTSGTESISVTSAQMDSIYTEAGFNFNVPTIEYHFFNYDTDNSIEQTSYEIFRGPVPFGSLIFHSGYAPVNRSLFNIYRNHVVFGGHIQNNTDPFQEDINAILLDKIEQELD